MEKTTGVSENNNKWRRQFSMIHEYPLDGNRDDTCLKIRKANELLLQRRSRNDYKINLSTEEQQQIQDTISLLASKGLY
jgi:hypothetical protein